MRREPRLDSPLGHPSAPLLRHGGRGPADLHRHFPPGRMRAIPRGCDQRSNSFLVALVGLHAAKSGTPCGPVTSRLAVRRRGSQHAVSECAERLPVRGLNSARSAAGASIGLGRGAAGGLHGSRFAFVPALSSRELHREGDRRAIALLQAEHRDWIVSYTSAGVLAVRRGAEELMRAFGRRVPKAAAGSRSTGNAPLPWCRRSRHRQGHGATNCSAIGKEGAPKCLNVSASSLPGTGWRATARAGAHPGAGRRGSGNG